jgi:3-deoxy-manno-octulosonate cytidylyltransferase (CMP-KDO synthetase)
MAASRLPGKPLADINGRPMILHVLARAREAAIGPVAVACADAEIAAVVRGGGGVAVLTDPALPSGSDRVHAALAELDPGGQHDIVVNLQGDFPTLPSAQLRAVLAPLADPAVDIGTLVTPITSEAEAAATSVVKAACAFADGQEIAPALYFSREKIPWGEGPRWHHIGVYAWRRAALLRFVALPPSPLERREHLEQLRALEAGMRIGCARVAQAAFGVDTPADLERARALLAAKRDTPRATRSPSRAAPAPTPTSPAETLFRHCARCRANPLKRRSRRCATARRALPCCRARTASPAAYRTSMRCCPPPACSSLASIFSGWSIVCWRRRGRRFRRSGAPTRTRLRSGRSENC